MQKYQTAESEKIMNSGLISLALLISVLGVEVLTDNTDYILPTVVGAAVGFGILHYMYKQSLTH